jgi:dynein heavy chain
MKTLLQQYVAQEEVDTPVTERSCAMLVHTSTTTTCLLRARLNELMLRRKGNTYGPENGTALKLWIDDVNTSSSSSSSSSPSSSSSSSSCSHELLRDVVEHNGVWESDGRKNYVDLSIVGTLRSSAGSISSRLARHFHIVGMCDAKESEVYKIFTTVMKWHLSTRYSSTTPFQEDVQNMGFSMVNATYQVHSFLKESFKPTPNGRVHCKQLTFKRINVSRCTCISYFTV